MYAAFQIIYRIHMCVYKWCFSTICEGHLISLVIFLLACVWSLSSRCVKPVACPSLTFFFPSLETDEVYKILFACLLFAFLSYQIIPFHGIMLLY